MFFANILSLNSSMVKSFYIVQDFKYIFSEYHILPIETHPPPFPSAAAAQIEPLSLQVIATTRSCNYRYRSAHFCQCVRNVRLRDIHHCINKFAGQSDTWTFQHETILQALFEFE